MGTVDPTPRELAVLAARAEGMSDLGVARRLFTRQASVEKHVTAIFRKLGIAPTDPEDR